MENKSAFISYGWDSEEHKQWVMDLANLLRRNGVIATIDRFITQSNTTNLNAMMIKGMRDNDFVIVVLTENFAEKADNFQGGVGFETLFSLPILQQNPDKLIFILRHKSNFRNAFPFHLQGYYAIDFSDDIGFNDSFQELLHRIHGVPLYEMEPVGPIPQLRPINSKSATASSLFTDIEIPNLKKITDKDKIDFLKNSYDEMNCLFEELFNTIKSANPNFDYLVEKQSPTMSIYNLFIDGDVKHGFKIWLDNRLGGFGHNSINLKYGKRQWDYTSDNSYNESIYCEVEANKKFTLKMTMNMYGNQKAETPEQIVKEIWKNNLSNHIK
ncbi:toll/interleukin-1 receptor domain-containing protein [Neobacillus drentensis]|uniref:toll/interleukin-1 receptor domain-containing protein n=1 Tax=Neobacillus drentensis TaxID=220684 RepID=UPI002FFEC2BF